MCSCQNIEHAFQQCRGVVPRVTHRKALLCFARFFPYTSRAVSSEILWGALAKNIGEMALGPILCFFLERIVPDAPPTFTEERKRGDVEQWFYLSARKAVKRKQTHTMGTINNQKRPPSQRVVANNCCTPVGTSIGTFSRPLRPTSQRPTLQGPSVRASALSGRRYLG